jgi:hypothetical protein
MVRAEGTPLEPRNTPDAPRTGGTRQEASR